MSSPNCDFSLILEGSIRSLVPKAKKAIEEAGGRFSGDTTRGEYTVPTPEGEIRGLYQIEGVTGDFFITKTPPSLPTETLKRKLMRIQEMMHALEMDR